MRVMKFSPFLLLLTCWLCVACDNSDLDDRLGRLEDRIEALEQLCDGLNNDISTLEAVVAALQNNDYITGVEPVVGSDGKVAGYLIMFSQSESITIYNGTDGEAGTTPEVSIRQDSDGEYYWTLDGAWMTGEDGAKIKAEGKDGVTPQLKIEDEYWYISYDDGQSWTQLGKATGEAGQDAQPSIFQDVREEEDCVHFVLADDSIITVPKYKKATLQFLPSDKVYVFPNGVYEVDYEIVGVTGEVEVKCIAQNDFEVSVLATDDVSGVITIIAPKDVRDSEILVVVVEDGEPRILQSIYCIKAEMSVEQRSYVCEASSTVVDVRMRTNLDYEVQIPFVDQSWLSYEKIPSGTEEQLLRLKLAANNTPSARSTTVYLLYQGRIVESLQVFQQSLLHTPSVRLSVDKAHVQLADVVRFTVMANGVDVTSQAKILDVDAGTYLDGNQYAVTAAGTMTFIAEYGGLYSQEVKIGTGDFVKNVAVWNFVSNQCSGSFLFMEQFLQYQSEYSSNAVVANIHVPLGEIEYDPMIPNNVKEVTAYYDGAEKVVPMEYIDNMRIDDIYLCTYKELEMLISSFQKQYTPVGIAVSTTIDGSRVDIRVDVTAVTAGSYGLGVWLVEDDVIAPQIGTDATYYHQDVFRENLTPVEGLSMGDFAADEQQSFSFTADVSAYDPDNCKIVVYVSQDQGKEQASILNAQVCPIGQYRAYQFQ